MQGQDYSCGAAALATMGRFYFGDDITEQDVLDRSTKLLTKEQLIDRHENGLSMNDLFEISKDLGYLGVVYRLPMEKIPELKAPVIVRIEKRGYKYFVVLRGSIGDRIHIADSLRGSIRVPADVFMREWTGEALLLGKKGFGLHEEHPLALPEVGFRPETDVIRRFLYSPNP